MLTVPPVAARPGGIQRPSGDGSAALAWRAHKVGTQHTIDERDLDAVLENRMLVPERWTTTFTGERLPKWVALSHEGRATH
jgi:hypothetical protein